MDSLIDRMINIEKEQCLNNVKSKEDLNNVAKSIDLEYNSCIYDNLSIQLTEKITQTDNLYLHKDEILEYKNDDECIILVIDGGCGDIICSTPMVESFKRYNKDKTIIVRTYYPEIFFNNPNIDHLYSTQTVDDMFEKYVKNLKSFTSIRKFDLYNLGCYKYFPGKLSKAFCYLYETPYINDNVKMYISEEEDKEAKIFLNSFDKEVILIQPQSARVIYSPTTKLTENKDWFKERWEEVIKELSFSYDIIQVGGKQEEELKGITCNLSGNISFRQTAAMLKNCLTFISIDSFLGHAGAAVNKRGVVLFGRSNPTIFGHDNNINIWIKDSCEDIGCGRPISYFGDNIISKGNISAWICKDRKCMKAISSRIVLDNVYNLIRDIKTKEKVNSNI